MPGPAVFSHSRLARYCCIFPLVLSTVRGRDLASTGEGRGGYCCTPPLPLDALVYCCFLSFDGGEEGMILRSQVLLCPLTPSRYGCILSLYCCILSLDGNDTSSFSRSDGGAEEMVVRALVLWYPLTPSLYICIISLYCCILSLDAGYGPTGSGSVVPPSHLDTAAFLRGLGLLCPLTPSRQCRILSF